MDIILCGNIICHPLYDGDWIKRNKELDLNFSKHRD